MQLPATQLSAPRPHSESRLQLAVQTAPLFGPTQLALATDTQRASGASLWHVSSLTHAIVHTPHAHT
jgi:hypothetical protein